MDGDRRKVHEYYQVNLDTGRIFWIAFLLGLVLIAVFVFGFFFGGGEEENLFSRLTGGNVSERAGEEPGLSTGESGDKGILDLFENGLDVETRYIDVESLEEASGAQTEGNTVPGAGEGVSETGSPWDVPLEEPRVFEEPSPRTGVTTTMGPAYYIQVGSFSKRENAERIAATLRKNLYKVVIEQARIGDGTFYRVRVGPFDSKGVAVNTMTSMRRRFDLRDPFVLQKPS